MKKIKLLVLLILTILIIACNKKEIKNDKFLEGPLTVENKEGVYLLYDKEKLATGVLKGKDLILGLSYDMYYVDGKPTGKTVYFNEKQKMIEVDMNFDYTNNLATGTVKIFDYSGNNVAIVGMQYLDIVSSPENFVDLKNASPNLKWYLENPVNVFTQVDILNGDKKISSIKDNRYFFYDDEGRAYEVPLIRGETSNLDDVLIYAKEDERVLLDEKEMNISYISIGKSAEKIKIGSILGNGMFKIIDDNDNSYVIEYKLGVPTGNFEIASSENGDFRIFGDGEYNEKEDFWKGQIYIYTQDENLVQLKNTKILGQDLFKEKNLINYSWISIEPTKEKPLDFENIKYILEADVYFNEEITGKIVNRVYKTFN